MVEKNGRHNRRRVHANGAAGFIAWALLATALLAGLILLAILGWLLWRVQRRLWPGGLGNRSSKSSRYGTHIEFYRRFESLLARYGLVRSAGQTQREFAAPLDFFCCAAGIVFLARRRQGLLISLLLVPLGLNFAAAAMHRFPYGDHMRLSLYAAATFCLLMGLGIAAMFQWVARRTAVSRSGRSP